MKLDTCPKCNLSLPAADISCARCGLVFAKWTPPPPWLGPYEYRMVQVAEKVVVKEENVKGNEGGAYLQAIVNGIAREGWEFYRVDEMTLAITSELFGVRMEASPSRFYVLTFRRPPLAKSPS